MLFLFSMDTFDHLKSKKFRFEREGGGLDPWTIPLDLPLCIARNAMSHQVA